jgi:hypothetical protein
LASDVVGLVPTVVGVLGSRRRASVDGAGCITAARVGWQLDWWIGADDRWRVPAAETAVRQSRVRDAPVVQTALRVPGGDAVQRVYGAGGLADVVVVEIENASPAPFVAALVLRRASGGRLRSVGVDGPTATVDGHAVLVASRPPGRWAASTSSGTALDVVREGHASSGPFPGARDRAGALEVALLYPVAHRTTARFAVPLAPKDRSASAAPVDLAGLPDADEAARGWEGQLARGLRVDVPDPRLQSAIDAARASLLLATPGAGAPDAAALEDWGFDDEAAAAWRRLSWRARRRAARRRLEPAGWQRVGSRLDTASPTVAWPEGPGPFLLDVRSLLAHEGADGTVSLLSELPPGWVGQGLEVQDAPTRGGRVSFAVRWHADRPALLWECEVAGTRLRAPGLDPRWSSADRRGEALLGAHPLSSHPAQ